MDIDLVLAGSGVRFSAYLGAIKALEELGYNSVRVIGSSGGAIAGALYSAGFDVDTLIQELERIDLTKFRKFSLYKAIKFSGIYSNKYVQIKLDEMTGGMKIKDAKREYHAVTAGEKTGLKVLNKDTAPDMTLGKAARMSAAVPFFYHKVPWKGDDYMDGGLLKNYPIDVLDEQRKVVGLRIKGDKQTSRKLSRWLQYLRLGKNLIKMTLENQEQETMEDAVWAKTFQIRTGNVGILDFNLSVADRKYLVNTGYKTVMENKGKL